MVESSVPLRLVPLRLWATVMSKESMNARSIVSEDMVSQARDGWLSESVALVSSRQRLAMRAVLLQVSRSACTRNRLDMAYRLTGDDLELMREVASRYHWRTLVLDCSSRGRTSCKLEIVCVLVANER